MAEFYAIMLYSVIYEVLSIIEQINVTLLEFQIIPYSKEEYSIV